MTEDTGLAKAMQIIAGDNIVGCTCPTDICEHYPNGKGANVSFLPIKVELRGKGIKTITIDFDDFELIETGTKDKNGKPVNFQTFKIL